MDWRLLKRFGLNRLPLPKLLEVNTLDGCQLYQITHRTQPIQLTMIKHHTKFFFYLFFIWSTLPLILSCWVFPGWSSTTHRLTGRLGRLWVGGKAVLQSASLQNRLLHFHSHHPLWLQKTPNSWISQGYLPAIGIWRRCSIRPELPCCRPSELWIRGNRWWRTIWWTFKAVVCNHFFVILAKIVITIWR